jgi:hypothetical protein
VSLGERCVRRLLFETNVLFHAHCAISSHPNRRPTLQHPQFDIEMASFSAGPANTRQSSATRIASFPESISVLAGEERIQREFQLPAGLGSWKARYRSRQTSASTTITNRASADRTPGAPSVRLPAILCKNCDLGRTEMAGNKPWGKAAKNCEPAAYQLSYGGF